MALYVDDLLLACEDMAEMERVKKEICSIWKCRDLGEARKFLGIHMTRNQKKGLVHLSQPALLKECLQVIDMVDCKPVLTPAVVGEYLIKEGQQIIPEKKEIYHSVVGKLQYVANHTRPDLSVAVSQLASFVAAPTEAHWLALKRILRYCKGTLDFGIVLGGSFLTPIVVGYADADFGGCLEARKSRTGYTFHIGVRCISHQSKQPTVALSTAEAEYMALGEAAKEMKWLRQLLQELGFTQEPTEIHQDNKACVQMANGNVNHQRSKHIDMRHHFVQEAIKNGDIRLSWVPSADMIADIMTKVLPAPLFTKFRLLLNVISLSAFERQIQEALQTGDQSKEAVKMGV